MIRCLSSSSIALLLVAVASCSGGSPDDPNGGSTDAGPSAGDAATAPVGYVWHPLRTGAGGFITGIDIAPDGVLMLARTDTYGLYRWTGTEWRQLLRQDTLPAGEVNDRVVNPGVVEAAISPSNPDRFYMAWQHSVYRSDNRGETWARTALTGLALDANDDWRQSGERLAIDPKNPDIVLFGSPEAGLYRTRDGGTTWDPIATVPKGLPESMDATRPTHGPGVDGIVFDASVAAVNGASPVVWATSNRNGVYRSNDGGTTWAKATNTAAAGASVTNAVVASDGTYWASTSAGLWKCTGAAGCVVAGPSTETLTAVAVDPALPSRVYAFNTGSTLYRSLDTGAHWTALTFHRSAADVPWLGFTDEGYMSSSRIRFHPTKQQLVFAEGIGVWLGDVTDTTTDLEWRSQNTGIEQLVANDVVVPPGGKPITASWDRALFVHESRDAYPAKHAPTSRFSSGWNVDWSPGTPQLVVGNATDHRGCCGTDGLTIQAGVSTNGGRDWTRFQTIPAGVGFGDIAVAASDANNIVWLQTANALPAYTSDQGKTWATSTVPGATAGQPGLHGGFYLDRKILAADRVNDHVFYLYHSRNGTYRSTDSGKTFALVNASTLVGPGATGDVNATLKTVPGRAGHLWLTPGHLDEVNDSLYHSRDGGVTWMRFQGVTDVSAVGFGKSLATDGYPAVFIAGRVGGDHGIWRSADEGATWVKLAAYPLGSLDHVTTIDGDKDEAGTVYLGWSGSGFAYGVSDGGPLPAAVAGNPMQLN